MLVTNTNAHWPLFDLYTQLNVVSSANFMLAFFVLFTYHLMLSYVFCRECAIINLKLETRLDIKAGFVQKLIKER